MQSTANEAEINQLKVEIFKAISQVENKELLKEVIGLLQKVVTTYEQSNVTSNLYITPDYPIKDFTQYMEESEKSKSLTKEEFLADMENW